MNEDENMMNSRPGSFTEGAIIDSHVHFWKYDKKRDAWITKDMHVLQKDYLPEHISLTLKRNEVAGVVAVQAAQSELETHFLMELAKTHPVIKGVVGWVDLQNKNSKERLDYFSQYPIIKGWRHIAQSEPDDFLLSEDFQKGIGALHNYGYTYDILVYPRQLHAAIELVRKFPGQKFVLDHGGKPVIKSKSLEEWALQIKELGKYPNVYCKLTGLFTEARKDWSAADFYPYLDVVFDSFENDRLLFGSDWPVMLLNGMYVQWKSLLEKYMEHFKKEERQKIMGENAIEFYNL